MPWRLFGCWYDRSVEGLAKLSPLWTDTREWAKKGISKSSAWVIEKEGSSPYLRRALSLSTVGHYELSTVVFISKTIRHPLNQLDLVVKSFCYTVAVSIPDIMDNRLKPPRQRPGHPLERFLGALLRSLNQLQERLAGRLFILALEPHPQLLHPVNDFA